MKRLFGWMTVVMLCSTAGAATAEEPENAKLLETHSAFDEATKLKDSGRYSEALARAEHALALSEAVLGSTHPDVSHCLHLVGTLYLLQGDQAHAEPVLQRALAIREAVLGKSHPDVATSLNTLGGLYVLQGLYRQAEPLIHRAITIRQAVLGKDHPEVAKGLQNLAALYINQGLYSRAEPLYQRALAIREAALGTSHPDVAVSLDNLAVLYSQQGLYGRAEPLYQRALAIREAALGKNHPDVATSLNNLALLYAVQGLDGRAEPLYQRALVIREAALGTNHPDVATSLNVLADLYSNQGLYDRAEPLYQRSLAIREAALGKNHPDVATALNNFALLYAVQGLDGRAEPLYQRALSIWEAALGKSHPLVAFSLNGLADLYSKQGLYERAEPLYQRALAIREAALGNTHRYVATSLNGLADLYSKQGLYERAEPLYQRALTIREAALGNTHPDVAFSLNSLARLRLAQHRLPEALPLFARAFAISEQRLRQEALYFSESRLASFLQYLRADEQSLYALLRAHPGDAHVRRLALGAALLLKGRSVEETADISRTVYRSLEAEDRDIFQQLRGLRTQRATLSLAGPGSLSPADYQQRLKMLADEGDALEAELAKRSAPLRALTNLPLPAEVVDRVAASLPKDSALVEFIAYVDSPLVPKPGTPRAKLPRQLRYLALVLFPDGSTRAQDLGPAAPIDRAATRLRDALARHDVQFQTSAQALYRLAFQPLISLLGGTRRLFLSPDGQLGIVPFAALHDGRQFLVDAFDFTYLTSGKDLLPRAQDRLPSSSVVVLADPDFHAAPGAAPSTSGSTPSPAERSAALERFFSTSRAEDLTATPWAPLPGTRQEAEAIQRLLPRARLFLGKEATKERLLQLTTPGILHLATHGFFLEDAPVPRDSRAVVNFGALGGDPLAARPPDPLLRSGLILAGAGPGAPNASDALRAPADNALVTALELAGMDLWGTQLVVLSACDTGRGDVKLGQGVYGLHRAFLVAGAETVVMSLWKVSDAKTGALMEAYYRNLLAGQGRATALREAMRELRLTQAHPHDWAPFISVGSDAPLRALTPFPSNLRTRSPWTDAEPALTFHGQRRAR
ncbi:CHAT domain-containing tetratricopeptide repeat protein [Pyxidicoccus sp. MSG2]|uniref:CHAT domain-containing tetratricopeptide repeat protein n=1 Tax=Pyxidicoccus sp. MSG2 TaxID=2996790 RepID=UPI0022711F24|nr:CHAT domain-containing tetratricopeptide repeat protein [Pyxidicoccus sp. MSG2]MCY1015047.1 CHAT domain-containing protein [Pyxidicoccus sp. MSG2]